MGPHLADRFTCVAGQTCASTGFKLSGTYLSDDDLIQARAQARGEVCCGLVVLSSFTPNKTLENTVLAWSGATCAFEDIVQVGTIVTLAFETHCTFVLESHLGSQHCACALRTNFGFRNHCI